MASPNSFVARWERERPNHLLAIGVAIVVLGLSGWVGIQARRASGELNQKLVAWRQTADQLAIVQQQFRVPTSTESAALISESAAISTLGIPADQGLSVMESLARLAEASSLAGIQINRGSTDSLFAAPRTVGSETINASSYSIKLDCTGSFASLVQFVSSLPPYASASHIVATRQGPTTAYHLSISVYELNAPGAD